MKIGYRYPSLWISAGTGVAARGNLHKVDWHTAAPATLEQRAGEVISVALWPQAQTVGAAFARGGPIQRCGSGTLAAAAALHHWTGASAGTLTTARETLTWRAGPAGRFSFQALPLALRPVSAPAALSPLLPDALQWYQAGGANDYWLARLPDRRRLAQLKLDGAAWSAATKRALIATAPGTGSRRYYLRYFAPQYQTPEDALTGSAHCQAAALWAGAHGSACGRQLSPQGGVIWVRADPQAVELSARCHIHRHSPIFTGIQPQ